MAVTPEALDLDKVRDFLNAKAGPTFGCAPVNCGGCPFACSLRQQTGEFRSGSVLTVNNLGEVPVTFKGIIPFNNPLSQVSGEPPKRAVETSEKTCSKCGKPASTCTCPQSEASKR